MGSASSWAVLLYYWDPNTAADFSLPGLWCGESGAAAAGQVRMCPCSRGLFGPARSPLLSVIAAVCCCRLRGKSWWCYWPESDHMRGTNKHSREGHRGRSFLTESIHLRVHHRQEVCVLSRVKVTNTGKPQTLSRAAVTAASRNSDYIYV